MTTTSGGYPTSSTGQFATGPNAAGNPSSKAGYNKIIQYNSNPANNPSQQALLNASSQGFATDGWYLFGAITVSIMLGNTPVGPLCLGVLTLALIYQTSQLLQGK